MQLLKKTIDTVLSKPAQYRPIEESDFLKTRSQFRQLITHINAQQTEEYHKNLAIEFLKNTQFQNFHINVNQQQDLVIKKDKNDAVQVIVEFKKPEKFEKTDTRNTEMISEEKPNVKSLQQLIFYYLKERIENENHTIKHLIISNLYEWYIFDENDFDAIFHKNTQLRKQYLQDYKNANKNTDYFYNFIAKNFIENSTEILPYFHLDLRKINLEEGDFKKDDLEEFDAEKEENNEKELVLLHKILSPSFLFKQQFENDSNTLNRKFYNELLYILGLEEVEQTGKKIITRVTTKERKEASFIENTIHILQRNAKLQNIKNIENYGKNAEEQYFNAALELCITWINRILFLKLLEAQLLQYHKLAPDYQQNYSFLNIEKLKDFDELDELFFDVLAIEIPDRKDIVKVKFPHIPYLNSSLFEVSELELATLQISNLKNHLTLPIYKFSIFDNDENNRHSNNSKPAKTTLQYLFEFLAAYDFGSENSKNRIRKANKPLISTSVLGLIFEKINGYKDGSFFTPATITMYMCRETLRGAVVQKFKTIKKYECNNFEELKNLLQDKSLKGLKEANEIVNSLRICDPAVGSGHFLVSALNELIVIKSELGIFCDKNGFKIPELRITIDQDELQVYDEYGDFFMYYLGKEGNILSEKHRIQEALFHEKKTLIENCLFGVDINANAVKICRLRLWIELLKNAYYLYLYPNKKENKSPQDFKNAVKAGSLHTLPNIDINIKQGNSLIRRFAINDKNSLLPKDKIYVKQLIEKYKTLVSNYKNNLSSENKQQIRKQITELKTEFENFSLPNDKDYLELREKNAELAQNVIAFDNKEYERRKNITESAKILHTKYAQKLKTIYGNSFEWRFEFPEILNEYGDFVGFDVVIGNPPYIVAKGGRYTGAEMEKEVIDFLKANFQTASQQINTYILFIELTNSLINSTGLCCLIVPNTFLANEYSAELRKFLITNFYVRELNNVGIVFSEANVETAIIGYGKIPVEQTLVKHKSEEYFIKLNEITSYTEDNKFLILLHENHAAIIKKLNQNPKLSTFAKVWRGLTTGNDAEFISKNRENETYKPLITGSEIERYGPLEAKKFVAYLPQELDRARDERIFLLKEKLISKFVGTKLCFTYDNQQFYVLNSACITELINTKISLKYLLALLNSSLLNFYFSNVFTDYRDTFPIMKSGNIEDLPIKIVDKNRQNEIEILVDKILINKQNSEKSQKTKIYITDLEQRIDKFIYELYEITEEEIKIIETQKN
jgi:hypothetical protein